MPIRHAASLFSLPSLGPLDFSFHHHFRCRFHGTSPNIGLSSTRDAVVSLVVDNTKYMLDAEPREAIIIHIVECMPGISRLDAVAPLPSPLIPSFALIVLQDERYFHASFALLSPRRLPHQGPSSLNFFLDFVNSPI